ncbi:MAG TPA: hypothetical protein VEW28_05560 [Candidatus Kapabacteria bacterium]|nr:hypothetical protein [Candidatus Kapabacteria bacterium]
MSESQLLHWCDKTSRVLLVIGALIVLSLPFFYPVVGYDGWIHLNWLSQFPRVFFEGNLYPRWMPDSFAGFGSPAFYFYPPLVYWVGGMIYTFGIQSPLALYQSLSLIFFILSGLTCYWLLVKLVKNKRAAFLGALLYCIFPYRFADLYMRNALTEHAAFVFIPIVAISLIWINKPSIRRSHIILMSAIGWAGVLLTNIPAFIIIFYGSLIYLFFARSYQKQFRKQLIAFLFGVILALAISAVFVIPLSDLLKAISISTAIRDKGFLGAIMQTGYALVDMFSPQKIKTLYWLLCVIIFLGGLMLLSQRRSILSEHVATDKNDRALIWILITALTFQVPYVFQFLWRILPMMPVTQFAWRWDIWITLIAAILAAKNFAATKSKVWTNTIVIASVTVTIAFAATYYAKVHSKNVGFNPGGMVAMDAPEYVPQSAAIPVDSLYPLLISHKDDREILISKGYANVSAIIREPLATTFNASVTSEQTELLFHRLYFPTWHLRDDRGVEYPIRSDSLGRIIATLPQGKRNYSLEIVPTNNERIGKWISIAGILCVAGFGIFIILSRKREASSSL